MAAKLDLVVGEGDSGFVHLFYLDPRDDGDLMEMRLASWNDSIQVLPVYAGPDTVRDFAACRDYTGGNYWLHAVVTGDRPAAGPVRFFRSTTYGRTWTPTDTFALTVRDPFLATGPGSHVYLSCHAPWTGGVVAVWYNWLYGEPGRWIICYWGTNGDSAADPVVAPAFTFPESTATVWCVWSQDRQNSGNWDVKYRFSTDGGRSWSDAYYLADSDSADESYPDLRNYTSLGNQYVNVSYISDDNVYRSVYRRYAHATTPDQWSDTLHINVGSAGTGPEIRPKLCYTPGGPFSGAGCVFVGAGLNGCWWNGPYPSAVAEPKVPDAARQVMSIQPSIGRGPFLIRAAAPASVCIHDRAGRLVRTLALDLDCTATWDGTDDRGRQLADGVYFCKTQAACRSAGTAGDYSAAGKVLLAR
jgi:hypothetical protein